MGKQRKKRKLVDYSEYNSKIEMKHYQDSLAMYDASQAVFANKKDPESELHKQYKILEDKGLGFWWMSMHAPKLWDIEDPIKGGTLAVPNHPKPTGIKKPRKPKAKTIKGKAAPLSEIDLPTQSGIQEKSKLSKAKIPKSYSYKKIHKGSTTEGTELEVNKMIETKEQYDRFAKLPYGKDNPRLEFSPNYAGGTGPEGITKNNDMRKKTKRKKRSVDSYAMGSGNTGVIKGYMPDPSEVFRQDKINADKAISEAAHNPFVIGLDMLGGIAQQAGMSMMGGAGEEGILDKEFGEGGIPNASDIAQFVAKGTGPEGTGTTINAEAGEVIETPEGEMAELGGKKHTEGGEDINVAEGTLVFSDQLEIDGKTMADRKKTRETSLSKMTKAMENDPTDMIAKETYTKAKEKYDYEEKQDLLMQGIAGEMDKMYSAAMGTGPEGIKEYGLGGKVGDFFGGFTGGDYLGMAGNLYSGIAPLLDAKKQAAQDTPNPNYFADYGQEGLKAIEDAGSTLEGQQAQAGKAVNVGRNTAIDRIRKGSRSSNVTRAMSLGADTKYYDAMSNLYTNFSKQMTDNLYKKAQFENNQDQVVMGGAKEADIANRMDAANNATQIGAMKGNLGTAIQTMGKDINQNAEGKATLNAMNQMLSVGDVEWNKMMELRKKKTD